MIVENNTVTPSKQEGKFVKLKDGRRLYYHEFGAPHGKPVLYCHGHPGSHLDLGMFDEALFARFGLRMISPDRPGIGQSDFLPGRRITDWPVDAAKLMDALDIPQFAVMGLSAGGPFAAVKAFQMPERVNRLVLVSSVGFFDIPAATQGMGPGLMYFRLARYAPWLVRLQLRLMSAGVNSDPSKVAEQVNLSLPPADLKAMSEPGVLEGFMATLRQFLRQGNRGPAWEAGLYMRPWGFPIDKIRVPAYLWHGEADRNAPVAMGRDLAARIPGCVASFKPGEGHFSLAKNHIPEILSVLAA